MTKNYCRVNNVVPVTGGFLGVGWRDFAGHTRQARAVRAYVTGLAEGHEHPDVDADVAALLADELFANAVVHSCGDRGGSVRVRFRLRSTGLWIGIDDNGAGTVPVPRCATRDGEDGRGLQLVNALATAWGTYGDEHGRTTWFWQGEPLAPDGRGDTTRRLVTS